MYDKHHTDWTVSECEQFIKDYRSRENAKSADMLDEWDHAYKISFDEYMDYCWPNGGISEMVGRA